MDCHHEARDLLTSARAGGGDARKQHGYGVVEVSAAGLVRWSSQTGTSRGGRGQMELNRIARLSTTAA